MLSHPSTNIEIQKYYQSKFKFKDVCSRNNLPSTVKDRAYLVNLDEYKSVGTHLIAFYVSGNSVTHLIALLLNEFQKRSMDLSAAKIS